MRKWGHGPGASRGTEVVVVFVNRRRIRFSIVTVLVLTGVSCSSKRVEPGLESTSNSKAVSSTPPFQTREPVSYRAIRSVTFAPASGSESTVTKVAIAKDGDLRREEETSGSKRVIYLYLPTGRFLLLPEERLYASLNDDSVTPESPDAEPDGADGENFYLHTGPIQSLYENLAREEVKGRTTTKYRVVVNNSDAQTVSNSETLIWVDESLGIPIKSVSTSSGGVRTMELSEVSLEVDKRLFQIPPDYQKVDVKALRLRLR